MGPDGHTASLFPHHPLLEEKLKWVAAINNSPKPPPERITFTLPLINNAKNVAFVVTGEAKKEKLAKILNKEAVPEGEIPSRLVQPIHGKLDWFVDRAAAQLVVHSSL
eukprot:TRINITY_DN3359_c0_g1_i2.p1 TRINITY_DN3359_c0_g1~~TRINITY_DN3359_c0_g1_i2.p1  ORF type:complete len:108 (-),score=24.22 TRINITY_DN3359_c0_g1_i2:112-435(-)